MKKLFVAVALSFCMVSGVLAQSTDSFFKSYFDVGEREMFFPEFPEYHGSQIDYNQTPLESGIVVFSIFGMGYVTIKRARKSKQ